MTIRDFIEEKKPRTSIKNILTAKEFRTGNRLFLGISDVTEELFLKVPNSNESLWNEFVRLRDENN